MPWKIGSFRRRRLTAEALPGRVPRRVHLKLRRRKFKFILHFQGAFAFEKCGEPLCRITFSPARRASIVS